jgi:RNA polymerase sigma factor (sigma-70 family)
MSFVDVARLFPGVDIHVRTTVVSGNAMNCTPGRRSRARAVAVSETSVMDERAAGPIDKDVVAAARDGDESAFALLVQRHQRELHVHCYRMLGTLEEAEDRVQETFLRAWRHIRTFEGRSTFRVWLYRIATNACLETLRRRPRQVPAPADPDGKLPPYSEMPWLEPYPDRLLDQAAPSDDQPDNHTVARETIELAFLAVIQLLPPRQRAVLILRDVLRFSAAETASLLDTSVPAANSALQRARRAVDERVPPTTRTARAGTDHRRDHAVAVEAGKEYLASWRVLSKDRTSPVRCELRFMDAQGKILQRARVTVTCSTRMARRTRSCGRGGSRRSRLWSSGGRRWPRK